MSQLVFENDFTLKDCTTARLFRLSPAGLDIDITRVGLTRTAAHVSEPGRHRARLDRYAISADATFGNASMRVGLPRGQKQTSGV